MKNLKYLCLVLFLFALPAEIYSQKREKKEKVTVIPRVSAQVLTRNCAQLRLGKIVFFQEPDYPAEAKAARVGGKVVVNIKLNEAGAMPEIESVSGHELLVGAATEAARKLKFTPTLCDGAALGVQVAMNYNFILSPENETYTTVAKIEDFTDVNRDSEFYQAIVDLTENYHVAYGYGDNKFYAGANLTRGDFVHFLRLTLDLLTERAKGSGKDLRQINLYNSLNPKKLKSFGKIKDIGKNEPFAESVKTLLSKYDIALVGEKNEFSGISAMTQNEVVAIWTQIFGADTIPVNFAAENGERIMKRGDFALFLQESLGVLTYKVLP